MLNGIKNYFMLWRPVLGGVGRVSEVILFAGVVAGALAQWIVASWAANSWSPELLFSGLVASILVYPILWEKAGLKKVGDLNLAKWSIAFEHGYFWPVLLSQLAQHFHKG